MAALANVADPTSSSKPAFDFASFLSETTAALDALTTYANAFPSRSDLNYHRTLDRAFARDLDSSSSDALTLADKLIDHISSERIRDGLSKGRLRKQGRRKLKEEEDVTDGYRKAVVDAVDGLLEDAVRI